MFENPAQVPYPQPYILWCWIDMREDGCCVVTESSYYTGSCHRGSIAGWL